MFKLPDSVKATLGPLVSLDQGVNQGQYVTDLEDKVKNLKKVN